MGKSCYNKRIPILILSIPSCHTRFNGVWVGVKVERIGNTFIHAFIANQEVYKQQVGLLCRKLHSYDMCSMCVSSQVQLGLIQSNYLIPLAGRSHYIFALNHEFTDQIRTKSGLRFWHFVKQNMNSRHTHYSLVVRIFPPSAYEIFKPEVGA